MIEAITGFRMHPAWFRIGGVAHDLPQGWDRLVRDFVEYLPKRLDEYQKAALENSIPENALAWRCQIQHCRSSGMGCHRPGPACHWQRLRFCVKGAPIFRATRILILKCRPQLAAMFTTVASFALKKCARAFALSSSSALRTTLPAGPYKADHPLTCPPPKERTLQDIETLITHFLGVSWGPVMPANESFQMIEATKGINSYYLTSDAAAR